MIETHPETTGGGDVPFVQRCIASTLLHWTARWKKRHNPLAIETGEARFFVFIHFEDDVFTSSTKSAIASVRESVNNV